MKIINAQWKSKQLCRETNTSAFPKISDNRIVWRDELIEIWMQENYANNGQIG